MHSLNKYLLSADSIPGSGLGPGVQHLHWQLGLLVCLGSLKPIHLEYWRVCENHGINRVLGHTVCAHCIQSLHNHVH